MDQGDEVQYEAYKWGTPPKPGAVALFQLSGTWWSASPLTGVARVKTMAEAMHVSAKLVNTKRIVSFYERNAAKAAEQVDAWNRGVRWVFIKTDGSIIDVE
jgi:hypothetical protein